MLHIAMEILQTTLTIMVRWLYATSYLYAVRNDTIKERKCDYFFLFGDFLVCMSIAFTSLPAFFHFRFKPNCWNIKRKTFFLFCFFSPFGRKFVRKGPKKKKNLAFLLRKKSENVKIGLYSNKNGINRKKWEKNYRECHLTAKRTPLQKQK